MTNISVVTILATFKEFPSWWYSSTLNWFTNFLLSSLQNSIKNIQTNQLRILELSDKNSIFCKEFKRHFVNINIPTLLIYRQVYLLAYRHLRCLSRGVGWAIFISPFCQFLYVSGSHYSDLQRIFILMI